MKTKRKKYIYAMYKGDEFLCEGTKEEICKIMNISINTFNYERASYYSKRNKTNANNHRVIIRIDK
ncbi:MAG: hypothetical protein IKV94_02485 [Clostridia bacterium]|nr:hypothetical protein [Clostridia bacterium]MBR6517117.1 hypothetical protein [Bacilli bacterium]